MNRPGFCFGLPFLLETPSVDQAAALCQREGLRFVELNSNFPQCRLDLLRPDVLREIARARGIFFTLHLDDCFDPFSVNRLVRQAYLRTMLEAITLCRQAEIPIINMHLPKGNIVTLPEGRHYIYQEFPEEYTEAVCLFRDACARAAGDSGLAIAVENAGSWESYEREAILRLLESPVFGLCLDTGHDHACDNRDLPFFIRHRDRLIHMHAHDGWGKTDHQTLGTGEIPLEERLALAGKAGATVVIETKTAAALSRSVEYLKEQGLI